MNLSTKHLLLAFLSVILLGACETPSELGVGQPQSNQVGVFFTDTFTLKTSTVLLDSVVSATQNNYPVTLLAGQYSDPVYGKVMAKSFSTVHQLSKFNPGEGFACDSMVLHLFYDYTYGNTDQMQTISVYQLSDSLNYNKTYYYTDEVAYNNEVLGTASFKPALRKTGDTSKEDTLRSIKIKFNQALAVPLGNRILNIPTLSNENWKFNRYFNGLALIPGLNNSCILGFSSFNRFYNDPLYPSSFIRLYYHNNTDPTKTLRHDFFLGNFYTDDPILRQRYSGSSFNHVTSNRSSSAILGALNQTNSIPSSQTDNFGYVQSALGVATKIEFPFIKSFKEKGRIGINKAELMIAAKPEPNSNNLSLPTEVVLAEANNSNQVARNSNDTPLYVQQEGVPVHTVGAQTEAVTRLFSGQYNFAFTSYLQAMLSGEGSDNFDAGSGRKPNRGLILLPSPFFNPSNPAFGIQGGKIEGNSQIKLKVHYTYLK
jgi:hypothetical protein